MSRVPVKWLVFMQAVVALGLLARCGLGPAEEKQLGAGKGPNRPPAIKFAEIQPAAPTVKDDLGVAVKSSDPDGDAVSYQFKWFINGQEVPEASRGALSRDLFRKGDEVQCLIVPADGHTEGKGFLTRAVRIVNSLPIVEGIEIKPDVLYPGEEAQVAVKARDLDEDPISISLDWCVNDQSVLKDKSILPLDK
jgi:hypothetical protein